MRNHVSQQSAEEEGGGEKRSGIRLRRIETKMSVFLYLLQKIGLIATSGDWKGWITAVQQA